MKLGTMKKYVFLILLLLAVPFVYADYSIAGFCKQPCTEGDPATYEVNVLYDIASMADEQHEMYKEENILAQTYVSKITVTKIILKEKISDWEIGFKNVNMVFADVRVDKNKNLSQEGQSVTINAMLPAPTTGGELSVIPCFEIEYEKELKEFDFFDGDYDSTFLIDTDTVCGDKVVRLGVNYLPPPICTQSSCTFYKHCESNGCKFSWSIIFYSVLIILVFVTLEEWLRNRR